MEPNLSIEEVTIRYWRHRPARRVDFEVIRVRQNSRKGRGMLQLGDDQNVDIRLRPLDDAGQPLPDTGTMTCTPDDPTKADVVLRVASGESAFPDGAFVVNVKALGPNGTLTLLATHTPADGSPPDMGTLGVSIIPTAEVGVGFEPSTPVHN